MNRPVTTQPWVQSFQIRTIFDPLRPVAAHLRPIPLRPVVKRSPYYPGHGGQVIGPKRPLDIAQHKWQNELAYGGLQKHFTIFRKASVLRADVIPDLTRPSQPKAMLRRSRLGNPDDRKDRIPGYSRDGHPRNDSVIDIPARLRHYNFSNKKLDNTD